MIMTMTINEMLDLAAKADQPFAGTDAWNRLEDHIATLSYGRINEILRYLPEWGDTNFDMSKGHGVLRSMCEDAKEEIERVS